MATRGTFGLAPSEPWLPAPPVTGCAELRADPGAESGREMRVPSTCSFFVTQWPMGCTLQADGSRPPGRGGKRGWVGAKRQRKGTRHLRGPGPAAPGKPAEWAEEFILGQSATKLLVPSAFFSSETILSRNENHKASEILGKASTVSALPSATARGDLRASRAEIPQEGGLGAPRAGLGCSCAQEGPTSWSGDGPRDRQPAYAWKPRLSPEEALRM